MKGRHYFDAEIVLKLASNFCYADFRIEQIVQRRVAQDDNDLWLYNGDLTQKKWPASMRFLNCRLTICGRPAAIDIPDKNVLALEADAFDYLSEQLSRTSDKRKSLRVFVSARRFANEHQIRLEIPRRMDNLRPARVKLAPRAIAYVRPYVFDSFARIRQRGANVKKRVGQRSFSVSLFRRLDQFNFQIVGPDHRSIRKRR